MSNVIDGIGEILSFFECSKCGWPTALLVKDKEQYFIDHGYGTRARRVSVSNLFSLD